MNLPPPAPSPNGDYNGNLVVDAADYVVWRETLDEPASPMGSGADGNANGTIDDGDYDFWKARFGNAVAATGVGTANTATSSPEPAAGVLIMAGSVLFALRRRR